MQNFLGDHTPRPPPQKGTNGPLLIQSVTLFKPAGYFNYHWNPCVLNLTDELSAAKEWHLNQSGTSVSLWCGKSIMFDRVCWTPVQLNLGSTHGAPNDGASESDVAPVLFQSWTYSIRFGTWIVLGLNQALQVKIKIRLKFSKLHVSRFSITCNFPLFPGANYSWIRARRQRKLRINLGWT